jgi:hypothetical protein
MAREEAMNRQIFTRFFAAPDACAERQRFRSSSRLAQVTMRKVAAAKPSRSGNSCDSRAAMVLGTLHVVCRCVRLERLEREICASIVA